MRETRETAQQEQQNDDLFATIPRATLEQAAREILRKRADDALSDLRKACSKVDDALSGTYYASEREIVASAENSITLLRSALDRVAEARQLSPLVEAVEVTP